MKTKPIHAIGRRKESVARAFISAGSGEVVVNGRTLEQYFPTPALRSGVVKPLVVVAQGDQFDVSFNITGGGTTGQAGAASLALARALVKSNADWKSALRKEGLLTVDSREVERKKYGRHKARKKSQYSKR
ncbi:MAG: 30S ribosomal protein S9 [Bdellovibrionota bacterium]|nr:MAG: 30S ribosomal protein S9 [Bdellovibrionota bacterium]